VFYFGNAMGESGNSSTDARVNVFDRLRPRLNPADPAGIENPFDYNRDGVVDTDDALVAKAHPTSPYNALQLISVPQQPAPMTVLAASALNNPPVFQAAPILLSDYG